MTIHYHGTPITPRSIMHQLAGRHFCVSFARPDDVEIAHRIGQSVMLDNGAFSVWTRGADFDSEGYRDFCAQWLIYRTTWAVIPDIIDGAEKENDRLLERWPFLPWQSAPVWHMHESLTRFMVLCLNWPRVCVGSSGEYREVGSSQWHDRMTKALNFVVEHGALKCQIHMLRGMALAGSHYPFASVDSTDIARNHNRNGDAARMAAAWDAQQCPGSWIPQPEQITLCG